MHKAGEQRFVANRIEETRNSLAVPIYPPQRGLGEIGRAFRTRYFEAVLNILINLKAAKRRQMVTHRDALPKLAQAMIINPVAQFRLPHQHDLQELAVISPQIGKQSDLLEQFIR